MTYDEIVARLIQRSIDPASIVSHERVLFRRYTVTESRRIVERLLAGGSSVGVGLPEDDGSTSVINLPAAQWTSGSRHIDVLPFVVSDDVKPDDPAWLGSRGFASRLRTAFHLSPGSDATRLLLLFDQRPVETEQTTASERLAASMDSFDALLAWLESWEQEQGFAREVFLTAIDVVRWWRERIQEEPRWMDAPYVTLLEQATGFMEACRSLTSPNHVGQHLPRLGVLFVDPKLAADSQLHARLKQNADWVDRIESIRRQRVLDPLHEIARDLEVGASGEPFFDALVAGLRSHNTLITQARIELPDIESRVRAEHRVHATLEMSGLQAVALDSAGKPDGPSLSWHQLLDDERPLNVDIVIPCPTERLRITVPITGDLPAFLQFKGPFVREDHAGADGELAPRSWLTGVITRPRDFEIVEWAIRDKRPARGRPSRPTQTVRVGIVAGARTVLPEKATLDADRNLFLVNGTLTGIKVQVGGEEVVVTEPERLPPFDGTPATVDVNGVVFRWAAEDRPPDDQDVVVQGQVRLLELVGIRENGDPRDYRPVCHADGRLGAACRKSALLDVAAEWMEGEAKLLLNPEHFAGLHVDDAAHVSGGARVVGDLLGTWVNARTAFFRAICEWCDRAVPGPGAQRPTMYLADLRDDELSGRARAYVTTYARLLEAVCQATTTTSNRTLIELVLLCDSVFPASDALRLAPTHPIAVALLASLQRGLLVTPRSDRTDRTSLETLLARPLLSGVLPWVHWHSKVLEASQEGPLLWRCYGTVGGTVDTSHELGPVVVEKVKRLLSLAPHLNTSSQRVYLNVEIGRGTGSYLVDAFRRLERDKYVHCKFDIGICANRDIQPALIRLFADGPSSHVDSDRERLHGFVRICRLQSVGDRAAHLVFRMEGADARKNEFETMSVSHPLVRDTGFAGGLSEEPARFARIEPTQVEYTRYVSTELEGSAPSAETHEEDAWDGEWRRLFRKLCHLSRHAAIGLHSQIASDSMSCQTLRQVAEPHAVSAYKDSFITVHCDPAQGPEFFVGARAVRSGVFLVECSDRGSPELPGRDIVSVTTRIGPFEAALKTAVNKLPSDRLRGLVDEAVTKDLLRDINVLRGTEVFDFLRAVSREESFIHLMAGLDNVLAMRFLMSEQARLEGFLPVVVSLRDFATRCASLKSLRYGTQCDDVIVFYIPKYTDGASVLLYRLVEVKFGPVRQTRTRAQGQLSETARKLGETFPPGPWRDEQSATTLLLERDVAWVLHEALERYRAFELLPDDTTLENRWGLRGIFRRLHQGDFELRPYSASTESGLTPVNGTALLFDVQIPHSLVDIKVQHATEVITVPQDLIARLLIYPVRSLDDAPPSPQGPSESPPPAPIAPVAGTSLFEVVARPAPVETASAPRTAERRTKARPDGSERATLTPNPARERAEEHVDRVFDGFVGNSGPVTRLKRLLMIAALEEKRWLEPMGLFGLKSTGKTELARRIARALDVPTAELSDATLSSPEDLANRMQTTADNAGTPMRTSKDRYGSTTLLVPPMVVFIDEVHLLKPRVQDSLLKATEPDDRVLLSRAGTIDTRQVTFIIATTDPGDLREAFKSRVARFELREYTLDELINILDAHRKREGFPPEAAEFDDECLRILGRVGRLVPRQALRLMRDAAREVGVGLLRPDAEALTRHYWDQLHADEKGLIGRDREYLRVLFPDHVVGIDSLAAQLGQGKSTISTDIEPYLLRLGLIERGPTGRSLTRQGRELVPRLRD